MTEKPKCEMDVFYNPYDDTKGLFALLSMVEAAGIARVRGSLPHKDCHTIYAYYPSKFAPNSYSHSFYGPTAINHYLNRLLK